ncbi:hypothetical protein BC829DRAFT_141902 [Chytridium lagenaria]|nr:hypothetical protein BC829DRAFT_141902 [Chytridium lagenaria]
MGTAVSSHRRNQIVTSTPLFGDDIPAGSGRMICCENTNTCELRKNCPNVVPPTPPSPPSCLKKDPNSQLQVCVAPNYFQRCYREEYTLAAAAMCANGLSCCPSASFSAADRCHPTNDPRYCLTTFNINEPRRDTLKHPFAVSDVLRTPDKYSGFLCNGLFAQDFRYFSSNAVGITFPQQSCPENQNCCAQSPNVCETATGCSSAKMKVPVDARAGSNVNVNNVPSLYTGAICVGLFTWTFYTDPETIFDSIYDCRTFVSDETHCCPFSPYLCETSANCEKFKLKPNAPPADEIYPGQANGWFFRVESAFRLPTPRHVVFQNTDDDIPIHK